MRSRAGDLGLGAVFVGALVFLYLPIAVLVGLSFNESGLPTAWGGFSTKSAKGYWTRRSIRKPLSNSRWVSCGWSKCGRSIK